jgi:hypothetical protein
MNRGYIKLHRRLLDSRVFTNAELLKVWLWCLLKASRGPGWASIKSGRSTVQVQLEPGEFIMGRRSAARELGMPGSTVWRRLLTLQGLGSVVIRQDRNYSLVSVVKWQDYQGGTPEEWTANGPQSWTANRTAKTRGNAAESQQVTDAAPSGVDRKPDRKVGHIQEDIKTSCPKPSATDDALRLASLLADLILANNPKSVQLHNGKREQAIQRWALDLDKLHRLDGQEWPDIEKVIRWSQADTFWGKNVLSGATLRKQWDQLILRVAKDHSGAQDWRRGYVEAE